MANRWRIVLIAVILLAALLIGIAWLVANTKGSSRVVPGGGPRQGPTHTTTAMPKARPDEVRPRQLAEAVPIRAIVVGSETGTAKLAQLHPGDRAWVHVQLDKDAGTITPGDVYQVLYEVDGDAGKKHEVLCDCEDKALNPVVFRQPDPPVWDFSVPLKALDFTHSHVLQIQVTRKDFDDQDAIDKIDAVVP